MYPVAIAHHAFPTSTPPGPHFQPLPQLIRAHQFLMFAMTHSNYAKYRDGDQGNFLSPSRTSTARSSSPLLPGDESARPRIDVRRLSDSWRSARNSLVERSRRLSGSSDGSSGAQVHQEDLWREAYQIESATRNRISFVTCRDYADLCKRAEQTVANDYAHPIPSSIDSDHRQDRRYFISKDD